MGLLGFVDYRRVWDYSLLKMQTLSTLNDQITTQEKKRREIQAEHDRLMKMMQDKQVDLIRMMNG